MLLCQQSLEHYTDTVDNRVTATLLLIRSSKPTVQSVDEQLKDSQAESRKARMNMCSVAMEKRKHMPGKAYQQPRTKRRKVDWCGIAQAEALCYSIQRGGEDALTCQDVQGPCTPVVRSSCSNTANDVSISVASALGPCCNIAEKLPDAPQS